jgi:2-polyprenyl-3-methyl-5-hydroxy-6-metoxy-1,4-benzoquinol methylase
LIGNGKKVLDLGCYDGTVGSLLQRNGNEVYGVDISEKPVQLAKQKGIEAYVADIEDGIPFPENSFDVVFAGELIEHVFDTVKFLEEVRRMLKKDGYLVLTTPNLASLGRRVLLLFGRNPNMEPSLEEGASGHIRYFVKDSLFNLLESHGFIIDHFTSDVINFNNSGKHFSTKIARMSPSLGKTLIIRARKTAEAMQTI